MSRKDRRHDPETAERVTSIIEAAERAAAALIDKADANAKRYLAEAEAEADRAAAARLQALNQTAEALISQAEAIRRESARLLETLRNTDARGQEGVAPQSGAIGQDEADPTPADAGGQAPGLVPQGDPELAPAQGDPGGSRGKHLAAVPGPIPTAIPDPWSGRGPDPGHPPSAGADPATSFPATPTPASGQFQGAPGYAPAPDQPQGAPSYTSVPGQPQGTPGPTPPRGDPHRSDGAAGARLLATQMAVSGYSRREIEAKLRRGFRIEDPTAILDAILGPGD